jgi:hypothetical protein
LAQKPPKNMLKTGALNKGAIDCSEHNSPAKNGGLATKTLK